MKQFLMVSSGMALLAATGCGAGSRGSISFTDADAGLVIPGARSTGGLGPSSRDAGTSSGTKGAAGDGGARPEPCDAYESPCSKSELAPYQSCVKSECPAEYAAAYGAGYLDEPSSGTGGGACGPQVSCIEACGCSATCIVDCPDATGCAEATQRLSECLLGSRCVPPACAGSVETWLDAGMGEPPSSVDAGSPPSDAGRDDSPDTGAPPPDPGETLSACRELRRCCEAIPELDFFRKSLCNTQQAAHAVLGNQGGCKKAQPLYCVP